MQSLTEKIRELETKANQLRDKYIHLIADHQNVIEENKNLIATINKQKELIQHLEETKKIIRTTKSFESNKEDQIKTKQIINEMMREIDKCLLLLDKQID